MTTAHGRHRAPSDRRMVVGVFEIVIMILFGTLGVLMVLLAHWIGGHRAR